MLPYSRVKCFAFGKRALWCDSTIGSYLAAYTKYYHALEFACSIDCSQLEIPTTVQA